MIVLSVYKLDGLAQLSVFSIEVNLTVSLGTFYGGRLQFSYFYQFFHRCYMDYYSTHRGEKTLNIHRLGFNDVLDSTVG